ncbi:transposase InsK for insertion sequence [Streptococcus pneumoniae]|nr:transposase InsK for insertion sequence [Streptococcus pneumoniae]
MNYTPKVRQKKSNFWGVFIMKLTYDDKVQIYELRKQGYILEKLSNKFGINNSNLRYMIKLIDRYGIEFVKKGVILISDYDLLLEKTITDSSQLFPCSSGTIASVFPKLARTFKTVSN